MLLESYKLGLKSRKFGCFRAIKDSYGLYFEWRQQNETCEIMKKILGVFDQNEH
jgi:hypothetical protein